MKFISYFVLFFIFALKASQIYAGSLATTDFNYINDFVGGRATGLGGAYTAISDDPSGAYYNPAGLSFALDNQISLSVNSYKEKHIEFEEAITNNDYNQKISSFYPSFFGLLQALGPFKFSFSIINLNNEILDQDESFSNVYAADDQGDIYSSDFNINFNITESTILAGLSLAAFLTNSLSIGFTVHGLKRRSEIILNQKIIYDKGDENNTPYEIINLYRTDNYWGVLGRLGIQYMPVDFLSLGFSWGMGNILSHKAESQYFYKSESGSNNFLEVDDNGSPKVVNERNNFSYSDDELPMNLRGGMAFFLAKDLIISLDCIFDWGNKYYQNKVNNTINGALGVEYYLHKSLPVRLGFFSNFANTPKVQKDKTNQEMHVDLYGCSFSLSWQSQSSSVSLSGFYQRGEGQAQIQSDNIQDTKIWMYSLSLTGSAKY